jgi:hypothetical protein
MILSNVQPKHIRYIKLGSSGWWAQTSFSEGVLCFGFQTIPHEVCEQKDWDEVWNLLRPDKKNDAAIVLDSLSDTHEFQLVNGKFRRQELLQEGDYLSDVVGCGDFS